MWWASPTYMEGSSEEMQFLRVELLLTSLARLIVMDFMQRPAELAAWATMAAADADATYAAAVAEAAAAIKAAADAAAARAAAEAEAAALKQKVVELKQTTAAKEARIAQLKAQLEA